MKTQNGAEALLHFSEDTVTKERVPKSYRNPELDTRLRTVRNRKETKILGKAQVRVPKLLSSTANSITMERISGKRLRDALTPTTAAQYGTALGTMIAKLHSQDIIHADLTTSNVLVEDKTGELVLIDFGLSYESQRLEDKAVDLHVLRETLEGTHVELATQFWKTFCASYADTHVLDLLKAVESRGRYKKKY